jgi:hypothetical protein
MPANYFIDLQPFSFSVKTDLPHVVQHLSTIYGSRFKELSTEVADYELSLQKNLLVSVRL